MIIFELIESAVFFIAHSESAAFENPCLSVIPLQLMKAFSAFTLWSRSIA